jgi:hypothetical protein
MGRGVGYEVLVKALDGMLVFEILDSPGKRGERQGECRLMPNWNNDIHPGNAVFVAVCFEGPDSYAQAGGLGVRITHLTQALAKAGYETHLVFIGDPNKAGQGSSCQGRLTLHRWCHTYLVDFTDTTKGSAIPYLQSMFNVSPENVIVAPSPETGMRYRLVIGADYQTCPGS